MSNDSVTGYIRKKLREEMNAVADHMASGGCANIDEYRYCCGKIEGLAVAEREILDIEKKLHDD